MSTIPPAGLACLACERAVTAWTPGGTTPRPRAKCPHCGSFERHRFLVYVLRELSSLMTSARAVLDVAPSDHLGSLVRGSCRGTYVGMDIGRHRLIRVQGDLTRLCFPADTFDVAICYHVFEHIPDDRAAMAELARVMRPTGVAFIQVPRAPTATTDEDPSASTEERIRRFRQADHVRLYGADFDDRLKAAGFRIRRIRPIDLLSPEDIYRFSLIREGTVWLCHTGDVINAEVASWLQRAEAREATSPEDVRAALARCRGLLDVAQGELRQAVAVGTKARREAATARAQAEKAARELAALRKRRVLPWSIPEGS